MLYIDDEEQMKSKQAGTQMKRNSFLEIERWERISNQGAEKNCAAEIRLALNYKRIPKRKNQTYRYRSGRGERFRQRVAKLQAGIISWRAARQMWAQMSERRRSAWK
jgi:hypothetical protein